MNFIRDSFCGCPCYDIIFLKGVIIMEFEKITLRKQAQDALIVKEVQFGEVKTQSFVDGKPGYIDRKDIKRLGYSSIEEYIETLKQQGYEQQ